MSSFTNIVHQPGNKIQAIENLGVTKNQFDSIDLSDNAIVKLEGFPKLPRLRMLLLSNNRIARIDDGLEGVLFSFCNCKMHVPIEK